MDDPVGQQYLAEMKYCSAFARANWAAMMAVFQEIITEVGGCEHFEAPLDGRTTLQS